MQDRKKQGKRKLNIRFCCLIGIILYLCYAIICQQVTLSSSDKKIAGLKESIKAANDKLTEVQDQNAFSKSDAYIEYIARERLGLVMADEKVYVDVNGR